MTLSVISFIILYGLMMQVKIDDLEQEYMF